MYQRKTQDFRIIQGKFGAGWEDMAIYSEAEQRQSKNIVKEDLAEYRASGFGIYRVISKRIKN